MNIDKTARELVEEIVSETNSDNDTGTFWLKTVERLTPIIKQALQEYGDECAKKMREDSARGCDKEAGKKDWDRAGRKVAGKCAVEIRNLPLPSEGKK